MSHKMSYKLPGSHKLLAAFFTSLFLSSMAMAQAPPSAPSSAPSAAASSSQAARHLTLKEALDMGERQNLDLIAARLQRAVSAAGVQIAGQRPNPNGAFGASRDTPHESLAVAQPFQLAGQRAKRIDVA